MRYLDSCGSTSLLADLGGSTVTLRRRFKSRTLNNKGQRWEEAQMSLTTINRVGSWEVFVQLIRDWPNM